MTTYFELNNREIEIVADALRARALVLNDEIARAAGNWNDEAVQLVVRERDAIRALSNKFAGDRT